MNLLIEKYHLSNTIVVRDLTVFVSRNTRICLKDDSKYAKLREGDKWIHIKIIKVLLMEHEGNSYLLMKYDTVDIETLWFKSHDGVLDIGFLSELKTERNDEKWIELSDDIELFGINLLRRFSKFYCG